MSEVTLTREQIEAIAAGSAGSSADLVVSCFVVHELCTLALERLDMERRPIAEAPNGIDILVWYSNGEVRFFKADDNDYDWHLSGKITPSPGVSVPVQYLAFPPSHPNPRTHNHE